MTFDNLLFKALKTTREKWSEKYKSVTYIAVGHGDFVTIKASMHRRGKLLPVKFKFAIPPEKFAGGLSKTAKVLMAVKGQVVNLQTREVEQGYFEFTVTVKISSDGDFKYAWLKVVEGKLVMYHLDTIDCKFVPLATAWIKRNSDYTKAYQKRKHVESKPRTPYIEGPLGQEEA